MTISATASATGIAYFAPETLLNPYESYVVLTGWFSPRTDLFGPGRELVLRAAAERDASTATGPSWAG